MTNKEWEEILKEARGNLEIAKLNYDNVLASTNKILDAYDKWCERKTQ